MAYTFIEGDQSHTSGPNGEITRIVLHATVSPCEQGGARANAAYFQQANAGGLAHYVVDPGEIICCCREDVCCWHAPPNVGSIGVELCDPQTGSPDRWADSAHTRMLTLAARLVADIAKRHSIPLTYVDRTALLNGAHGITTHFEVSQAWHQSDHTDPGQDFPMGRFLDLVHGTTPPVQEDDMARLISENNKDVYGTDGVRTWHVPSEAVLKALVAAGVYGDGTVHPVPAGTIASLIAADK